MDTSWKTNIPIENRYYETTNGILYHGNSLEILHNIPNGIINLIVTDPPYNVSKTDGDIVMYDSKKSPDGKRKIKRHFGEWDTGKIDWTDYIDLLVDKLQDNGVLVMFYERVKIGHIASYLEEKHNMKVRHIGAFVKTNPPPHMRKVGWQHGLELFLVVTKNHDSSHHFNYKLGQSPDYYIGSVSYKHYHPTQKPLEMIEWIVNYWSFEGDIVLDPFTGSGTTLLACEKLNRRWIGIELEQTYCDVTKQRIEEYVVNKQNTLFG